jgi:hypothetical protein
MSDLAAYLRIGRERIMKTLLGALSMMNIKNYSESKYANDGRAIKYANVGF